MNGVDAATPRANFEGMTELPKESFDESGKMIWDSIQRAYRLLDSLPDGEVSDDFYARYREVFYGYDDAMVEALSAEGSSPLCALHMTWALELRDFVEEAEASLVVGVV